MAAEMRRNRGVDVQQDEVKVNGIGKGTTFAIVAMQAIIGGGTLALLVGSASVVIEMREFMAGSSGNRFTDQEGAALTQRVALLEASVSRLPPTDLINDLAEVKIEDRRLQRQIDRLENAVFTTRRKPTLPPYTD